MSNCVTHNTSDYKLARCRVRRASTRADIATLAASTSSSTSLIFVFHNVCRSERGSISVRHPPRTPLGFLASSPAEPISVPTSQILQPSPSHGTTHHRPKDAHLPTLLPPTSPPQALCPTPAHGRPGYQSQASAGSPLLTSSQPLLIYLRRPSTFSPKRSDRSSIQSGPTFPPPLTPGGNSSSKAYSRCVASPNSPFSQSNSATS